MFYFVLLFPLGWIILFFFFMMEKKKKKNQCIYLPKNCCFNRFSLNLISAVFMTLEMFFSASLSEEKII